MFGQWTDGSNAGHRGASLTTVFGLVVASFVAVVVTAAPANAAVCQDPQTNAQVVGGFEIDGNLCQNSAANSDWDTTGDQPVATDAITTTGQGATTDTTAFTEGANETNGPNWSLGQAAGRIQGAGTADRDIGNIYASTQVAGDSVFAYFGFERAGSGGAMNLNVELNKLPNNDPSCAPGPGQPPRATPNPCRSPGDLLLRFNKGGGAVPITLIAAYTWDPTRTGVSGTHWIQLPGTAGVEGRSNSGTIRTLDGREIRTIGQFGEIGVNLTDLFGPAGCSGHFGTMNMRTVSGGSFGSSLVDWVDSTDLNVPSTCPEVVLQKRWVNGANGDRADLSINGATQGDPGFATSIASGDGNFTDIDRQANVVVEPGSQVDLAETLHSGNTGSYDTSLSCNHDVTPNNGTITVPDTVGAGDTVTCTFTNARREATLTFTKNWAGNSTPGDQADLRIETPGGTTGPETSTAPGSTTITRTVFSGDPVTVVEALGDSNASSYSAETVCTPNVDNLVLRDFGASFTVPNTPGDITCTITNMPVPRQLTLLKNWVNGVDGVNGDTAGLTVTIQGSGVTNSATATVPSGGNGLSGNAASVPIVAGETVTLSETLPAPPNNRGTYQPTALRCNGTSIPIPDATGSGATGNFQVPANGNAPVTCEFTNEARYTVHLTKQWGAGSTAPDTATLNLTNATTSGSDSATAIAPDPPANPASVTAAAGDTINLAEVLDKPGAYAASLSCDNGVTPTPATGTNGSFTVPSGLTAGTTITCTFLNESRYTIELTKSWGPNAVAGNTAHLTIRNADTDDSSTETAIAPNPPGTPASVTASAGDSIHLDEAFGANNVPYDASLSCDAGPFTVPVPGTTGVFQVEPGLVPAGGTIHCTFKNTRQTATVVLQKHWNNAATGDSTDLSINGATQGDPGFATSKVTNQPTFTDGMNQATATVQTGDQVTVSENMGANTGSYDTVLSCDDGVGELPADNGTFTVTAAMAEQTVTCTFENTRHEATVVLQKHWNNGATNDSSTLTITGGEPTPSLTATSTITPNRTPTFTDIDNQAAAAIQTGDVVTLTENLPSTNTGSYKTALTCDNNVTPDSNGRFTVTAAMVASGVTCTFTNTRQSATVVLQKHWNNGAAGDSSTLTITGGEPNPSNPTTSRVTTDTGTTFTDRVNQAAVAIQTGDQVTVSENMANGNTGSYDTVLSCDNGIGTLPVGNGTFRVTAAIATKTVICTFTNTRQSATVVLQKRWANAATGDRAALRIAGGTPNPATTTSTVTTATGPTFTDGVNQAAAAIHTGDVVTLTENLPAANTARYARGLACNNGAQPNANGTFTVTAAMAATTVTCTFTNTRQPATLSITKTSTATRIVPGVRVPYSLRVRNTGPSAATNVVVRDTLPRGLTFVSSTPRCTAAGQVVTCNLGTIPVGGVRTINMVTRAARPFPAASITAAGNVVNAARVTSPSSNCPTGSTRPACNAHAALPVPRSTPHVRTATSRGRVLPGRRFFDRIWIRGLDGSAVAVLNLYGPFSARAATTCTTRFRAATRTMRVRNGVNRSPAVRVRAPGWYTWRVTLRANARNQSATHRCGLRSEKTVVAKRRYQGPKIRGGFTGTALPSGPAPAEPRRAPVMIQMPAIGMRAPVVPERVVGNHMVLPSFRKVGWLKKSDNFGDKIGSVVVGGHVSSFRDIPGAMFRLKRARAGQLVTVTNAGTTYSYKVTGKTTFSRQRKIPHKYFTTTGRPRLVMVSCVHKVLLPRGRFTYTRYIIVVAKQIGP